MVTLIWMSQESQTPGLPQRMANCMGDQWDAPMGTVPHAALITAPTSLLGSAAFPRDPCLPQTQVGRAGRSGPSPWDQGWIWAVLM